MFLNIDKHTHDSIAMVDNYNEELTYGRLCDFCETWQKYVPSRSVVLMLCENRVGALAGYVASIENKVVPILLGASVDELLLNNLLFTYQPNYIWKPKEVEVKVEGEELFSAYGFTLMKTHYAPFPIHESLSLLMPTSGSTGSPKLVRYKYGNLEANARNVAAVFGWTKEERPICDLPIHYTMGLNVINSHLYVGAKVLLTNYGLMSGHFWDYLKQHKATNFTGVPFSYEVLSRLRFTRMDLPHLTTLAEGGGKLTEKQFTEYAEYAAKSGKRFFATFGTTETAARLAYLPPHLATSKIGSIGNAIPEGELRLIDEEGAEIVENGVEGELVYRGPNVTMGYALTKEDLQKGDEFCGEYRTGDLATRDEDGCYYIVGRRSRFVKLFGHRVGLDDCEKLINHAFDLKCACVGTDKLVSVYVTDGKQSEEIHHFIAQKTKLMRNCFRVIVIDALPLNEAGKILYSKLSS